MKFKVKELCQIICGGTPSTTNPEYWDGDIVWLTPKDLSVNKNKYIVLIHHICFAIPSLILK